MVVFDLGEVLATPKSLYDELAAVVGSDAASVEVAYWSGRDAHDRGSSVSEYWSGVVRLLGQMEPAGDLLVRLSEVDSRAWVTIRPDAADLMRNLHEAGHFVAVLSNAPTVLGEMARKMDWAEWVDEWFFSGDLKIAKPNPAIYEYVALALPSDVSPIVFFDDRQINVDAAKLSGWDAYLWTSGDDTRSILERLGYLGRS